MKNIKRILRSVSLFSLVWIAMGFHELTWATSVATNDINNPQTNTLEMKNHEIRKPARQDIQNPGESCVIKHHQRICVQKNDRVKKDKFKSQTRPNDFVDSDVRL